MNDVLKSKFKLSFGFVEVQLAIIMVLASERFNLAKLPEGFGVVKEDLADYRF